MKLSKRACLLTGPPGSGKTTLLIQALSTFQGRASGFYTTEVRDGRSRLGFDIITLDGKRAPLAKVDLASPFRVGRYGVAVDNLEKVGVASLKRALAEADLVVVDEIGKMEFFSPAFKEIVDKVLCSQKRLLGTIMLAPHPWANEVKAHPQVELLLVERSCHSQLLDQLNQWLNPVS